MPTLDLHSPLRDAVRQMAARTVTGSGMGSREWELLPAEIRLRAMFSARVEHERTLAEMKARLEAGISGERMGGATMDRSRFIEEMRQVISQSGYQRPAGVNRKSLRNLKSRARLELIWNMNVAQARGYARWLADMDPHLLTASPCYELVRMNPRREIREWPLIWEDHGGKFYGTPGKDYPRSKGRMIAKKTDPIWRWISRFKTPWPPFDWGSGMGLVSVLRSEAETLDVIGPDEDPQEPLAEPFNAETSASVEGVPAERVQALLRDFSGVVELHDGRIKIIPPAYDPGIGKWFGRGKVTSAERLKFDKKDQPPPPSDGTPVSDKVAVSVAPEIKHSRRLSSQVQAALAIIDSVHSDGSLPGITAIIRVFDGKFSFFSDADGLYRPVPSSGLIPELLVSPDAVSIALAVIHEMGHFLDNLGLHTPRKNRLYASEGQPEMEKLMSLILGSNAVSRLTANLGSRDRLVSVRECFARAYSQFIAEESGSRHLLRAVREVREGHFEQEGTLRDLFWFSQDFAPIRREMKSVFNLAGWVTKQ